MINVVLQQVQESFGSITFRVILMILQVNRDSKHTDTLGELRKFDIQRNLADTAGEQRQYDIQRSLADTSGEYKQYDIFEMLQESLVSTMSSVGLH